MEIPRNYPVPPLALTPAAVLDTLIRVLNDANKADPAAVALLINNRVPCNQALADHPTIQVGENLSTPETPQRYRVGMLGIINGLAEAATGHRIACVEDDAGNILGFQKWAATPRS